MKTKLYFYFLLLVFLGSCGTSKSVKYIPDYQKYSLEIPQVQKLNDSTFSFKENYLTKNTQQQWELYIKGRLNRAAHKMWGDGMFLAQPGRKKSVLTNYTWNHVSCDGYYARLLPVQFNLYLRMNHDAFVVIGHPKGLTHFALERLELFIPWAKNKVNFSTYESFVCK